MRFLKRLFHPLTTFIGVQIIWVLLVVFWIYWFVGRHKEFRDLAARYQPSLLGHGFDWIVLAEGLGLLICILGGIYVIFLYWKRQATLYQRQKGLIAQITHELKSPLASIKLHLETIRLRNPSPDRLERFLETMLSDTERLDNLISNLLMVARLEQRIRNEQTHPIDLSELIKRCIEVYRPTLPEDATLSADIDHGIKVAVDSEGMNMVIRNLIENSILYSDNTVEIRISLRKAGSKCVLLFQDNGRGIDSKDMDKIFRMFYRVRLPGDNIKGTGLGLYIVKSIISEHGGTIRAHSQGVGQGCSFKITLPLCDNGK